MHWICRDRCDTDGESDGAKGYLKKAASSEDGRITYLSLTEAGRELSRIYNEQFFTTLTSFMEGIPEEDVKCTIRTIDAVHQIMCERRPDLDKCKNDFTQGSILKSLPSLCFRSWERWYYRLRMEPLTYW